MPKIAKLAIQSGLPQLDRLFDYAIPDKWLPAVEVGSRVKVTFGKSKKALEGFVVEISDQSTFEGKLSEIESVLGNRPALQPEIFALCSQLADRSASSVGELLKIAVPSHMPRAFASHSESSTAAGQPEGDVASSFNSSYLQALCQKGARSFALAEPKELSIEYQGRLAIAPSWVCCFIAMAVKNLASNKSSIILVPDYREQAAVLSAIAALGLDSFLCDYSQELPKSKQYAAFLRALDSQARIIVGSRSAALAPAHDLGSIMVFDEADRSYSDQAAPYLHTREVSLVRQSIQECSIFFTGHSMSTDLLRLVESGFLLDQSLAFASPRISMSEPGIRVDSHAFGAIRKGLSDGAVLVQVSSLGDSTALYCQKCDEPAKCTNCSGPLWIEGGGAKKCRWCNGFALDHHCVCGGAEFTLGRAGSSRTAAELGRAFPNARVIESTGDNRLISVSPGRTLVVATAGAEPYVVGGYFAVVLLDARVLLARQHLRSTEEAVRVWSNAVAKARSAAPCVLVGVSGDLSKLFSLWNHRRIAVAELSSRQELQLPPAVRLGSVTAQLELVSSISNTLAQNQAIVRIGPAPVATRAGEQLWRLIFKYPYSEGLAIAKLLKLESARISAGKIRVGPSGRGARAITVKMNDAEVV